MKNKNDDINTTIVRGISVSLLFVIAVAVIIGAIYMYSTRGEFVNASKDGLSPDISFYIWTLAVIFVSSILYTPISFGISNYFINAKAGKGNFRQVFYLFKSPLLLLKAVVMSALRQIIINIGRFMILLVALVAECGLFVISAFLSGENIFIYEKDFLQNVMDFITSNDFFIILTVIEWCVVLVFFFWLKMRYIMCKYALIRFPELTVIEAIRIGRYSISGRLGKTFFFYIKYLSLYIVTFLTFGLSGAVIKNRTRDSFSTYAVRTVERGREAYYLH